MTIDLTDDEALAVVSVLKFVPEIVANHQNAATLLSLTESVRQKLSAGLVASVSTDGPPRTL